MQRKAVIHLRKHLPRSLAGVASVYNCGNIFVVQRKCPDVEFSDEGEDGNVQRGPDSRNILVVEFAEVLQRPQAIEMFLVLGKQLLHDSRELWMFGGGLAHGALLHQEIVEKLRDQALLVLELSQVGLRSEP